MKMVKILFLIFKDVTLKAYEIPKLRGYFASTLKHHTLLHNHLPGNKFDYKFPRIQYRIIENNPALLAIEEGVKVIEEVFFQTQQLVIGSKKTIDTNQKMIQVKECFFGQSSEVHKYSFTAPWLALNKENYQIYRKTDLLEQQVLLKKILKGNLMTLAKGFDYTIDDIDKVSIEGIFIPKKVNFKNVKMQGFTGSFMTNFCIPDLFGLGKQSARGFGVIRRS
ncbi:CRISPR-associated endonuclease Cas6 [Candidatus Uabimicrobium sp. HlEnr_7]|uniref:CRISPR-associated endonuclease Cas6 n=1 Tax=Candidatus Uabimicrobium helgolandensis TaxID=3095367 RepID=UPI003559300D